LANRADEAAINKGEIMRFSAAGGLVCLILTVGMVPALAQSNIPVAAPWAPGSQANEGMPLNSLYADYLVEPADAAQLLPGCADLFWMSVS
jgi:hypothetical protein